MKINGVKLSESSVQAETRRLLQAYRRRLPMEDVARHMDRIRAQARDLAIGRQLLLEEAVRQGIDASPAEIEEDLDRLRRACGTPREFEDHLRRIEATPDSLRRTLAEARQVDELTRRLTADVPAPSEEDLRTFYQQHAGDFDEPERARVSHILIRADMRDGASRQAALSRIRVLRDQLAAGDAEFAALALEHSDCPSGREDGGHLGWIHRGMLHDAFEAAAFALAPGDLSEPVETPYGFHLVRVDERQPGRPAPFEEARDRIREHLLEAARNRALQEVIRGLREKAVIQDQPG